ncbi:hypothetical protein [Brachybacterium sp. AOP3-A1-3]|uniref:hypothetical protein n=1 Tax=Brachybacterium sp. AOP3-A1-3 TaxID=3457699 RepID=UPI004033A42F
MIICHHCNDEKVTDDNDDITERVPWSFWQKLTPPSDMAVRMGMVKPIPCAHCQAPREQS